MFNFFKNIFGIPSNHSGSRNDDLPIGNDLKNNFRDPIWGDDYSDDDEDLRSHQYGSFGFPIFSDPIEIHKYFEGIMDEMLKSFSMFGFHSSSAVTWRDDESDNSFPFNRVEDSPKNKGGLRDAFLKSPAYGYSREPTKEDSDLDGKVNADDLKNFLENDPKSSNEVLPVISSSSPKFQYSSVYVRTIRRPDGSVETIRKVRDHTGKEETTITQDTNPQNPSQPTVNDDDIAGISVFKKFFPF